MEYCAAQVLSVARRFVPALDDLFRQSRVKIDRCAYHVGGDLTLRRSNMSNSRGKPFFESVFIPLDRRQIGYFGSIGGMGDSGSTGRLSSGLHLHGD